MDEISSIVLPYVRATYRNLETNGIRWPQVKVRGKRFFPVGYRKPVEWPNEEYPLWIIPRGFHYHYGIGTINKRAKGLAKVFSDTALEMNPEDARKAGVNDRESVKVISPRAEVETICRISEALPEGIAYLAGQFFPVPVKNLLVPDIEHNNGTALKEIIGK